MLYKQREIEGAKRHRHSAVRAQVCEDAIHALCKLAMWALNESEPESEVDVSEAHAALELAMEVLRG